ncbi:MAG: twitching motility protein PilT [Acidimicrobiia bacterium]|nr:MAG: twitching motility protein PilT [Acidimicrobiia bacterium]
MSSLDELLQRAVEAGASDVHLKVGSPPGLRVGSELRRIDGMGVLRPEDTEGYARDLLGERTAVIFEREGEVDFAYGRPELGRFRVSIFRQRGSICLVLRRVTPGVPSLERLGVPQVVKRLAELPEGVVLVTGPSGSGKSTTLAAMVEYLNGEFPVAITTVEDPIEVLFPDRKASVTQREVGVDTPSFADAIRRATRRDCDVLMVSEIADPDCAQAVVTAAETGHLVLAAMHSSDPGDTLESLVDLLGEPTAARKQLARTLKGVVSQRLVEGVDGPVLACEILVMNDKAQELVRTGAPGDALLELMKEARFFGMTTFEQSLLDLVTSGRVSQEEALVHVRNPHEFKVGLMKAGVAV